MKPKSSTEQTLASIVLGFEIVVVFLTGLTVFGLKITNPPYLALIVTGVVLVAIIFGLAFMRKGKIGLMIGWILHALFFLPAIILPPVALIALIFGALWVYAVLKGRQIDALRRQHELK